MEASSFSDRDKNQLDLPEGLGGRNTKRSAFSRHTCSDWLGSGVPFTASEPRAAAGVYFYLNSRRSVAATFNRNYCSIALRRQQPASPSAATRTACGQQSGNLPDAKHISSPASSIHLFFFERTKKKNAFFQSANCFLFISD